MKKRVIWTLILALILGLAVGASSGCSKKEVGAPGELSAEEQARLKAEEERRLREQRLREGQAGQLTGTEAQMREIFTNQDIHYDYDRYDLRGDAKQILNDKSGYMQSHPELNVIVEGHCDERGSASYNMALGEKRARAAAAYLQAMGISAARMETVTYGKEKPLVQGNTEEAFAANRRAHFVIK
ncbi:MAG: peptidoglycan-associated lipoprotein Pal [Pseudomonadota bacterium]